MVLDSFRYLTEMFEPMVKVTLEVPESLLGDIYIAVGKVLERGRDDADQGMDDAADSKRSDGNRAQAEA